MFYGVGSKRRHIRTFVDEKLTDGGLVEVNAWRSAVTAKRIIAAVLSALTGDTDEKLKCASALCSMLATDRGTGVSLHHMWGGLLSLVC